MTRRKKHKWAKVIAYLSVGGMIFLGIATTALNVSLDLLDPDPITTLPSLAQFDDEGNLKTSTPETPVAAPKPADRLLPMGVKISDPDDTSTSDGVVGGNEVHGNNRAYRKFWKKVERNAVSRADYNRDGTVTEKELATFKYTFVTGLGFRLDPKTGIVHMADGKTHVRVSTLECFFNGYVPERPYIKPNCPPN